MPTPKNIILCADGTWDSTTDDTNVVKLYRALINDALQVAYYDDGVGSDGTEVQKLMGGAFGDGLVAKVQDGYSKIAQVYNPGDNIYIFGFSRGAYTARSVAGMIATCGLPPGSFDNNVLAQAFNAYRNPAARPGLAAAIAPNTLVEAKITMVGVWDTVGALGIPAAFGGVDASYGFLDTGLHPNVINAYHAVSIDERRREFPATLWTGTPAPGQTVEQAFFVGVHCDVGGGYPDCSLSDITLAWMMNKAAAAGARFNPDIFGGFQALTQAHALGPKHESWDPLWGIPASRSVPANAMLANSVALRCAGDTTYRPSNLSLTSSGQPQPSYTLYNVL